MQIGMMVSAGWARTVRRLMRGGQRLRCFMTETAEPCNLFR